MTETRPDTPAAHRLVLPGRFRAVVFDMDGLLIDSEPLWVVGESRLLEGHGHRYTDEDLAASHGRSIEASVTAYALRMGIPVADVEAELLEIMRDLYLTGPAVRPGASELVHALHGRMPLAVASSTSGSLVRTALEGAGLLGAFSTVVSGHDLGAAKPEPDAYLEACRALDVAPGEALAFEDSTVGIRSARTAGLYVVGVPERDGLDLAGAGADLVLTSLADVVVEG